MVCCSCTLNINSDEVIDTNPVEFSDKYLAGVKSGGGYCPTNKDFNEMYKAIGDSFQVDEHKEIREAWIENKKKRMDNK